LFERIECKPNYWVNTYNRKHPEYSEDYDDYGLASDDRSHHNNHYGYRLPHPIERHSNGLPKDNSISYRTGGQRITYKEKFKPNSNGKGKDEENGDLPDIMLRENAGETGVSLEGLYDEGNTYGYDLKEETTTPSPNVTQTQNVAQKTVNNDTKKGFKEKSKEWIRKKAIAAKEKSGKWLSAKKQSFVSGLKERFSKKGAKNPPPVAAPPVPPVSNAAIPATTIAPAALG
jgi:hypothetical protein